MPADTHTDDPRFWTPRRCDLTSFGVRDRIQQYREDNEATQ